MNKHPTTTSPFLSIVKTSNRHQQCYTLPKCSTPHSADQVGSRNQKEDKKYEEQEEKKKKEKEITGKELNKVVKKDNQYRARKKKTLGKKPIYPRFRPVPFRPLRRRHRSFLVPRSLSREPMSAFFFTPSSSSRLASFWQLVKSRHSLVMMSTLESASLSKNRKDNNFQRCNSGGSGGGMVV